MLVWVLCVGVGVVCVGVVGVSEGEKERTYNFVCPQVLLHVCPQVLLCLCAYTRTHAGRKKASTHQHHACKHARTHDARRCDLHASV